MMTGPTFIIEESTYFQQRAGNDAMLRSEASGWRSPTGERRLMS
jgi:hypothetical protein